MKTISRLWSLTFVLLSVLFFTACNPAKTELLPVLTTTNVTSITITTANSGGTITSDGGSSVTARGVCWSTTANPTIADSKTFDGAGIGSFTSSITGLTAGTAYFVQAYATNSAGTGYGSAYQFTTGVTDIDGNVYHVITIGTQTWMVENLKTTKYNDGTAIPNVTTNTAWAALSTGAYCNYNNNETIGNKYGRLYNWNAIKTGKLAPTGWHVPTDVEWTNLENYLIANGYNYDGTTTGNKIAKSLASTTTDWTLSTNAGAVGNDLTKNNKSGFTALPDGFRYGPDGNFYFFGTNTYWWTSTAVNIWFGLKFDQSYLDRELDVNTSHTGFPVRCIKD